MKPKPNRSVAAPNAATANPDPVYVEIACPCALRDYPHYHSPEIARWLRRVWVNDCSGDGQTGTINTFSLQREPDVCVGPLSANQRARADFLAGLSTGDDDGTERVPAEMPDSEVKTGSLGGAASAPLVVAGAV